MGLGRSDTTSQRGILNRAELFTELAREGIIIVEKTKEFLELKREIDAFVQWSSDQPDSVAHKVTIDENSGCRSLSAAFVAFLSSNQNRTWTPDDHAIVDKAVRIDWARHSLMTEVPSHDLRSLLILPTATDTVRMYLLIQASKLRDLKVSQDIALNYFENDHSDAVRDRALEVLAKCKWARAEEFAILWWNSGNFVKQLVALNVLRAAESNLLDHYIELARQSKNSSLEKAVSAMI
jgi:hypothetical protein